MPITRVLVATDFSETSEAATSWAIAISRAHGASIHLVHALPLAIYPVGDTLMPPVVDQELENQSAARLEKAAARIHAAEIEATTQVRNEVAWRAICNEAADSSADLVVMGTQGLSGLEHLLLGSTAERVIQHAPCPVLAVHPGDLVGNGSLARILVPTDFSEEARIAAQTAIDLLGETSGQGELILVHAHHLPLEYGEYATGVTPPGLLESMAAAASRELDSWALDLRDKGWKVRSETVEGLPSTVIQRLAQEHEVDLIAMGTHGRSGFVSFFLGSTAKRVVPTASCPVLTVRRQKAE